MADSKIIDYTTRKRESTKDRLLRCPVCGRIGVKKTYTDGSFAFQHKMKVGSWFVEVTDNCLVSKTMAEDFRKQGIRL
jgi:nitrogen fixation protein FixH